MEPTPEELPRTPLWSAAAWRRFVIRSGLIKTKAAPGRRTPRRRHSHVTASTSDGMHICMPGLWNVDDQAARLAELTSQDADLKEAPLRRDVRSLGRLLGEVLKEQVGDRLFSAVEELRLLLIEHRELHAQPGHDLDHKRRLIERAESIVSRLNVAEAHQMAKAFAIYFELTNLAETNHRK